MTLREHIDDIRNKLKEGHFTNEATVSDDIVRRLLHDPLGWPRYEPQIVYPQYSVEGGRVDFALCHPPLEPRVFIEVKQVEKIEGAEEQLFRYAFRRGVPIAIFTDGQKWQFFHPAGEGTWAERKVCELDLITGDSEENAQRLNRYLDYESIQTSEAVEAIKKDYKEVVQQRQVATRLPEAWSKLVEEADEFLLHAIAEKTENLCGYKPTDEQVLGFLKNLKSETGGDNGPDPPRKSEGLFVTMPNGDEINHSKSVDTFVEVIEKLGIERVRNLNKKYLIPLISTSEHHTYTQRKSGRYYIMANTSTKVKERLLKEIASELGEPLKVEIVEKS